MSNLIATILAVLAFTYISFLVVDMAHVSDCRAAADTLHTITVNGDLFESAEAVQAAAAPHLEFFTKECS